MKKVEFLDMVIRPQKVEMQRKKVDRVLSWLVPRNIKEVQKFLELANYYK